MAYFKVTRKQHGLIQGTTETTWSNSRKHRNNMAYLRVLRKHYGVFQGCQKRTLPNSSNKNILKKTKVYYY